MSDLISRQAAINAIQNDHEMSDYYWSEGMEHAMEIIRSLPSAEPVIVRCKDCKHSGEYYMRLKYSDKKLYTCDYSDTEEWFEEDFFCANGEREVNEDE